MILLFAAFQLSIQFFGTRDFLPLHSIIREYQATTDDLVAVSHELPVIVCEKPNGVFVIKAKRAQETLTTVQLAFTFFVSSSSALASSLYQPLR